MTNYINLFTECTINNKWAGTPLEKYAALGTRQRGAFSESAVKQILSELGFNIESPQNPGHDFIMNGIKTELKFGLTTGRNNNWRTMFNHIGLEKDWEQLVLACINGDLKFRIVLIKRDNLSEDLLQHQQGGNKSENDDYMISGVRARKALFDSNAEVLYTNEF